MNLIRAGVVAAAITFATAAAAEAGTISLSGTSGGGRPIAAEIDYTFGAGFLDIDLHNTTLVANTFSAGELLTGINFTVSVGSGVFALVTATGDLIELDSSGAISSTTAAQSILSEWTLVDNGGGALTLDWNQGTGPDYGIIGAPDGSNEYPNANPSLTNGSPHQPYVLEVGHFRITNSLFTANSTINFAEAYFGTDREGHADVQAVPLPPAALLGFGLLGGAGVLRTWRRRRNA
jgi:hypothetical protein